jgi:hypothetical protein
VTISTLSALFLLLLFVAADRSVADVEANGDYCVQFDDCLVYMDAVMRSGKFDGDIFSVNVGRLCELTERRPKTIQWSHGAWIPPAMLESMRVDIERWSRISARKLKHSRKVAEAEHDFVASRALTKQIQTIKPLYAGYVQDLQNDHQRCIELYRQCMNNVAHHTNCMGRYIECRQ